MQKTPDEVKRNLSRRDFLKGTAAGVVGLATAGVLGCTPANTTPPAPVEAAAPAQNTPIPAPAPAAVPEAKADYFAKPAPITDIAETVDVDVVVIGAGNGGCVAAVSAMDAGAKVAWVEKNNMPITWAGEIAALNSKVAMEDFGVQYTLEQRNEIVNEICRYASYQCDQRLVKLWAENSGRTMDWYVDMMAKKGLSMFLETDMKDSRYMTLPVTHTVYKGEFVEMGPNQMGSQLSNPLWVEFGNDFGAKMMFEHTAMQLVQGSDGKVTGLIVQRNADKAYIQINAPKGVIISTGGYSGNPEMMDALQYRSRHNISNNLGGAFAQGDGIKMALWAGAAIDANHGGGITFDRAAVELDHHIGEPYTSGLGDIWWPGSQPWIKVNTLGERFMNEDNTYDYNIYGGITQPGTFWFQLFDSNYWEDVQVFHTTICSRVVAAKGARNSEVLPGVFPAKTKEEFEGCFINPALENGKLQKADTIPALAQLLGLPADKLQETIDRYNELAAKGVDDDFGKQKKDLRPVLKAPFYGIAVGNWLLCTFNGIRVNTNMEAVNDKGEAIKGLYMVGNDMGGFFANSYPQLFGGLCQGKTTCFARLAALHAVNGSIYEA